ncbi:MAG TPA: hypothetical protein VM889_02310 [Candidatus Thermoplasmatota archaeon]|nr:hypothetical protein [Candidatus Thermoplasmatota archaeon]
MEESRVGKGTTGGTGVTEIRRELENVNFPATKNDIVTKVGTREIKLGNRNMSLKDVINRVPKDRFESRDDLLREIQNNVPEFRSGQTGGGGVGGGVGGGRS